MQPHVFVVMPFGQKEAIPAAPATDSAPASPAVLVDFNEVYEDLIKPALLTADCIPFRADQEQGAGDILTDMYFELVTADVVLADISILNPNVFYELGVRHGVATHGVFMIHGGWSDRPFDIAPDRTFNYDGTLFVQPKEDRDETFVQRIDAAISQLAKTLREAVDTDNQSIGSPVYNELKGLKPVDWSEVETARACYFGEVFTEWRTRIKVAQDNGFPGDILTLADDAPTRFHRVQLLWASAKALIDLQRYEPALSVLDEVLNLDPRHKDALAQYGLVLARRGEFNQAREHMLKVSSDPEFAGDTETQGILGGVYKDLWQIEWGGLPSVEERQLQACASSSYLMESLQSYELAFRKHASFYTGINIVSLAKLLDYLKAITDDDLMENPIKDLDELIPVVRFFAKRAIQRGDLVWAEATLGELELVAGDAHRALSFYQKAAHTPDTKHVHISSMLCQLDLFERLGFRLDAVMPVMELLGNRAKGLEETVEGSALPGKRSGRVIVFSGHAVDGPDQSEPRFPPAKEVPVRDRIDRQLEEWGVKSGDLAICGGARGGDILFAELCAHRGADVWLYIARPVGEFLEESVRLEGTNWEQRFFDLQGLQNVRTEYQIDRLKKPPKNASVSVRNNRWIIHTATVEANDPKDLYALLVWNEKPCADGFDATADFAEKVKGLGGHLAPIINPTIL